MINKELEQKDKKKVRLWLALGAAFFVFSLILSVLVFFIVRNLSDSSVSLGTEKKVAQEDVEKKDQAKRLIDGLEVEKGEENLAPIAIMIDNHVDARPASGLEKAQLVFEAEVEGGITRLLAFFASNEEVEEIGPVRSARPYFIDWAKEFSALYVHVGGSPEALAKMINENTLHLNEFYNEFSFWRDNKRTAPHNVMTSSKLLGEYLEKKEIKEGVYLPWQFEDESKPKDFQNHEIDINYRRNFFDVKWKYDFDNNSYIRFQGEEAHKTKSGDFIIAKNVLIVRAESEEIDEKLRLKMNSLGEGSALVCAQGACQEAKWRKLSGSTRLRFYDENDSEISLLRGKTWVQVIGPDYEVVETK